MDVGTDIIIGSCNYDVILIQEIEVNLQFTFFMLLSLSESGAPIFKAH